MRSPARLLCSALVLLSPQLAAAQWSMPPGSATPPGMPPPTPGAPPSAQAPPGTPPPTPGAPAQPAPGTPPPTPPGTPPATPGAPPPATPGAPPPTPPGTPPPDPSDPATPTQPGTPPPPPADPYGQPVTAGGLHAPPPMDPTTNPPPEQPKSETEKELDEADEDDSGRGLTWFWLDVEGGYQYVGLETFTVDQDALSIGFESSDASGGYAGAGLGFQLFILRIGPRFRVGFFDEWQLYSIDGEVGFRIPVGIFEPHFEIAAGYSALGSISGLLADTPDAVRIDGFNVRVGGGLDVFATDYFSIGGVFSWEFLGLTRPGVDPDSIAQLQASQNVDQAEADVLAAEGSGYGTSITIGARLGLHF